MIFSSRYGNEFVDRAIELRSNCRVNLEIIQKLSKRQASLETRKKLLKQIAYNGINLHLDDNDYTTVVEKQDMNKYDEQRKPSEAAKLNDTEAGVYEKGGLERSFSSSSSNTDAEDLYDVTWTAYDLDRTASPNNEEIDLDQSDEETGKNQNNMPWFEHPDPGSDTKSNLPIDIFQTTTRFNAVADESFSDTNGYKPHGEADLTTYSVEGRSGLGPQHSNADRRPTSITYRIEHSWDKTNVKLATSSKLTTSSHFPFFHSFVQTSSNCSSAFSCTSQTLSQECFEGLFWLKVLEAVYSNHKPH
ncbi:hypothetical protein RHGRI_034972 [Rhododendron griersonianum]|uniref:Uncharacterized protein n=1 Tax=Rhododendron griersonianum TaxID=479676 RepID=A0AAV6I7D6_9ERIC|nr:hypothetical protein RHGRI_034972 [Rhododendron griersonianum]